MKQIKQTFLEGENPIWMVLHTQESMNCTASKLYENVMILEIYVRLRINSLKPNWHRMDTYQVISCTNRLTGFYYMATLIFKIAPFSQNKCMFSITLFLIERGKLTIRYIPEITGESLGIIHLLHTHYFPKN